MSTLCFLSGDDPWFWDRASGLNSSQARARGVLGRLFSPAAGVPGDAILVFNRVHLGDAEDMVLRLAARHGVPRVADIDDLYWDLPDFTSDPARGGAPGSGLSVVERTDRLCRRCGFVSTPSEFLGRRLSERFPDIRVVVVPNAPPAWHAPPGAVLIANTDNFKLAPAEVGWFSGLVVDLVKRGIPVQLLGDNPLLAAALGDWEGAVFQAPRLPLRDYLLRLATGRFALGLVPVAQGGYGDSKSAIKLLEFLQAGIPVVASSIRPYQETAARFPGCLIRVVPNSEEAWRGAMADLLPPPSPVMASGLGAACSLKRDQVAGWLKVGETAGIGSGDIVGFNRSLRRWWLGHRVRVALRRRVLRV